MKRFQCALLAVLMTLTLVFTSCSGSEDAGTATKAETQAEYYVICNKKSKKFHDPSCAYLPKQSNRVKMEYSDAIARGYEPCGHCNP